MDYNAIYCPVHLTHTNEVGSTISPSLNGMGEAIIGGKGWEVYEYNGFNQPIQYYTNDMEASYTYRPDGLRQSQTENGSITTHIWDGANIALDISIASTTKYIRGNQLIAADGLAGYSGRQYYSYNAHGDVVQLTDSAGNIKNSYDYDTWGKDKDALQTWNYEGNYDSSVFTGNCKYYVTGSQLQQLPNPLTRETDTTISFASSNSWTYACTNAMSLEADTPYVLEFDYWSDSAGPVIRAGSVTTNYATWIKMTEVYPTTTAQRIRIPITFSQNQSWNSFCIEFAVLGQTGTHVSNVRICSASGVDALTDNMRGTKIKGVVKPSTSELTSVLSFPGDGSWHYGDTKALSLTPNTIYTLEFEYWAAGAGSLLRAGSVTSDFTTWISKTDYNPTTSVQKASFDFVFTSSQSWNNFRIEMASYGPCEVYVANVKLVPKRDGNPFRYTGEYKDLSSGTYYLRARNYQPTTGRFLTEDSVRSTNKTLSNGQSIVDPNSLNLYTYSWNNPMMYSDPSGNSPAIIAEQLLSTPLGQQAFQQMQAMSAQAGASMQQFIASNMTMLQQITNQLSQVGQMIYEHLSSGQTGRDLAKISETAKDKVSGSNRSTSSSSSSGSPSPGDPNNWNHRDYLLKQTQNAKLRNAVSELYRKGATVGDGGTADMLRHEFDNGQTLKHLQKAHNMITHLNDILTNQTLTDGERTLTHRLLNDLYGAIKYVNK